MRSKVLSHLLVWRWKDEAEVEWYEEKKEEKHEEEEEEKEEEKEDDGDHTEPYNTPKAITPALALSALWMHFLPTQFFS